MFPHASFNTSKKTLRCTFSLTWQYKSLCTVSSNGKRELLADEIRTNPFRPQPQLNNL